MSATHSCVIFLEIYIAAISFSKFSVFELLAFLLVMFLEHPLICTFLYLSLCSSALYLLTYS